MSTIMIFIYEGAIASYTKKRIVVPQDVRFGRPKMKKTDLINSKILTTYLNVRLNNLEQKKINNFYKRLTLQ